MGKIRKEYKEDRMESYVYTSHTSESSQTSGSSGSSSSDSESGSSTERKRKHTRKKSKYKREKKRRSDSEEDVDYIERERRKRKYVKHKETDDTSEDEEEYIRVEERKHRSRKHKHHHRKHKHKHRRHRHHRSEEEYQERRRGGSVERGESRREREEWEEKKYDKVEKDRKNDKELDRKNRKEEKRYKERGDNRQMKSKWDDDEDVQFNINKRIKPDPDSDDFRGNTRVKQEGDRNRKRRDREEATENGRSNWGTGENPAQNIDGNDTPVREEVHKPNMGLSGKLAEDTNTFNGVVIKYSQPPEARKPKRRWRWYIFKGEEDLPFLPLHRQSAYLIGRDRKVADIPTDHPSCSKQHAVLQYRLVTYERDDGTKGRTVKPYILDLESANGTYVNNRRVESRRFVELIEKDVVKFGYSSREYILLHEGSKGDDANAPDMGVDMSPVSLLRS